ncbi:MAG: phosphoribosyltransferase [Candidatus Cloacimonetes bacterium]|nr:phosphoribosyltransferase [Candidatus Cloacimonadota bacterium]
MPFHFELQIIPKIDISKTTLAASLVKFANGSVSIYMSKHIYPELFEATFPEVVSKAGILWGKANNDNQCYCWFPSNLLSDKEIENMISWIEKFRKYQLIGLNPGIKRYFSNELDYCMALDKRTERNEKPDLLLTLYYTEMGKIVHNIYENYSSEEGQVQLNYLIYRLKTAFTDLPIQGIREEIVLSTTPVSERDKRLSQVLTERLAQSLSLSMIIPTMTISKPNLQELTIDEKIRFWNKVYYYDENIRLNEIVRDKVIIVIDDIYNTGVTLWSYAKYLKEKGAKLVIGLVCVKKLTELDNNPIEKSRKRSGV